MKFFPENRKKTIGALVLILVCLGGMVYLNFFIGKSNRVPVALIFPPAVTPTSGQDAEAPPAAPPVAPAPQSAPRGNAALLPFGPTFDTSIFESEKFKALKAAPPVDVTLEELGKTDPFK